MLHRMLTKNKCVGWDVLDPTRWEIEEGVSLRRCVICDRSLYPGDRVCTTEDYTVVMHESCAFYHRGDMTVSEVLDRVGIELYAAVEGE